VIQFPDGLFPLVPVLVHVGLLYRHPGISGASLVHV
jgi:hypothetical protein